MIYVIPKPLLFRHWFNGVGTPHAFKLAQHFLLENF